MCLTCGCGDAHRVMGKNLTYEELREMAVENERTVDETLSILATTASADRKDHQQEYDQPWDTGKS